MVLGRWQPEQMWTNARAMTSLSYCWDVNSHPLTCNFWKWPFILTNWDHKTWTALNKIMVFSSHNELWIKLGYKAYQPRSYLRNHEKYVILFNLIISSDVIKDYPNLGWNDVGITLVFFGWLVLSKYWTLPSGCGSKPGTPSASTK